jgi:hypothetical protein
MTRGNLVGPLGHLIPPHWPKHSYLHVGPLAASLSPLFLWLLHRSMSTTLSPTPPHGTPRQHWVHALRLHHSHSTPSTSSPCLIVSSYRYLKNWRTTWWRMWEGPDDENVGMVLRCRVLLIGWCVSLERTGRWR